MNTFHMYTVRVVVGVRCPVEIQEGKELPGEGEEDGSMKTGSVDGKTLFPWQQIQ